LITSRGDEALAQTKIDIPRTKVRVLQAERFTRLRVEDVDGTCDTIDRDLDGVFGRAGTVRFDRVFCTGNADTILESYQTVVLVRSEAFTVVEQNTGEFVSAAPVDTFLT